MAIQHKFLVGSTIAYQQSLFFDLMTSGNVYMGFARTEPIWGFNTLIKLGHQQSWPTGVMGQSGEETGAWVTKYYDINSIDDLPGASVPANAQKVEIAYINKNDDDTVIGNYNFLDVNNIGDLILDYMNEEWCRVRRLNAEFFKSVVNQFSVDDYDYWMFNRLGSAEINSKIKIETVDTVLLPQLKTPVRLMYSTDSTATSPSSAFGSNVIGNLTRSLDIYGQETITGILPEFVTKGNGYIEDNSLDNSIFFITTADGSTIQDGMVYIETVVDSLETSIVFSYPIVGEATQNSGRLKLTISDEVIHLAVFPERFTTGTEVNDINPVPLVLNYLKMGMNHSSIMDVLGLIKIDAADVKFARRVDNDATQALLASVQDIDLGEVQLITIDNNPDTTVTFATTSRLDLARQYYFDLTMITKTVTATGANSPTEELYRQLFICYKPQTSAGANLTATLATHDDLFNTTEQQYDLGTILFIANKEPVYRLYLSQNEVFTLLI